MIVYQGLLIASGILVLIAVALYFLGPGRTFRLPAIVLGVFGGFGFGTAFGMGMQAVYGGDWALFGPKGGASNLPAPSSNDPAYRAMAPVGSGEPLAKGKSAGMPGMGGMAKGGGMGGGMGGGPPGAVGPGAMGGMMGGGMGGRGLNSKIQLATLITKLEQLTGKPLALTLDDAQRGKIRQQLQGLGELDDVSQDEAKKRLDGLLDVVKDQRQTLEDIGYRWPGAGGGGFGGGGYQQQPDLPNPFKQGTNNTRLKALRDHLAPIQ